MRFPWNLAILGLSYYLFPRDICQPLIPYLWAGKDHTSQVQPHEPGVKTWLRPRHLCSNLFVNLVSFLLASGFFLPVLSALRFTRYFSWALFIEFKYLMLLTSLPFPLDCDSMAETSSQAAVWFWCLAWAWAVAGGPIKFREEGREEGRGLLLLLFMLFSYGMTSGERTRSRERLERRRKDSSLWLTSWSFLHRNDSTGS